MSSVPPETPALPRTGWVRPLVDFGALAAFVGTFLVFRLQGVDQPEALIRATWALVIASTLALITGFLVERRLAPLPLITGVFALVFGVLTIVFHDPEIIKIKVTVLNGLLAAALLGGLVFGVSLAKVLLGSSISLSDRTWRILTIRYGLYFAACAIANEVVRLNFDEDTYIGFRSVLWVAALVFGALNLPLILKDLKSQEASQPEPGSAAAPD